MTQKTNILIPDGNSTWAMSVITCLSEIDSYKLYVLSSKKRTAAKYSRHISYYKFYEKTSDDAWIEIINSEIQSNQISVIVPIAEPSILFLIENAEYISKKAEIIPLPSISNFRTAINKFELNELLEQSNIPHPKSIYINHKSEIEKLSTIDFPVLVKPLFEKGGDGIQKFDSIDSLKSFIDNEQRLFIQEYIQGYDIDCSVLCLNGEILCHTIQKGNLPGHSEFAPHLGFDFLQNTDVYKTISQMMSLLNWSGVAHIDLRFDEKAKDFKILEINGRFWGSVESSKIAGINFPDLAVKLALGKTIETQKYRNESILRFKGFLKLLKQQPKSILRFRFIKNHTEVPTVVKDPLPIIYRFFEMVRRKI